MTLITSMMVKWDRCKCLTSLADHRHVVKSTGAFIPLHPSLHCSSQDRTNTPLSSVPSQLSSSVSLHPSETRVLRGPSHSSHYPLGLGNRSQGSRKHGSWLKHLTETGLHLWLLTSFGFHQGWSGFVLTCISFLCSSARILLRLVCGCPCLDRTNIWAIFVFTFKSLSYWWYCWSPYENSTYSE